MDLCVETAWEILGNTANQWSLFEEPCRVNHCKDGDPGGGCRCCGRPLGTSAQPRLKVKLERRRIEAGKARVVLSSGAGQAGGRAG